MGKGQDLYLEAKRLIPGGTQLLSKRPEMFLPDFWPAYYSKAKGCDVWDLDGTKYTDMSFMGIGANVLGYAVDEVDLAAKEAISVGGMCTLNAPEEVELAKLLVEMHPWAEMVRYAKAGGEMNSLAVRIMRAYTKKDIILFCGYHGWHDWYLSSNLENADALNGHHLSGLEPVGVPKGLAGTNLPFRYNNFDEFMALAEKHKGKIAGIIMEPIRNDEPKNNFLQKIRKYTQENNILLAFDEISSGFRLCPGGSHLVLGVEPDLAMFGKAIANGYPICAVIGRREVMQAAQNTFISSTFWTERVALAAAIASIHFYQEHNVNESLNHIGKLVQDGWATVALKYNLDIDIGGIYPMGHFAFKTEEPLAYKTYFTQEMLKEGFLASTAFYASFAHGEEHVEKYLAAVDKVFADISHKISNKMDIKACLPGGVCHAGFARLN